MVRMGNYLKTGLSRFYELMFIYAVEWNWCHDKINISNIAKVVFEPSWSLVVAGNFWHCSYYLWDTQHIVNTGLGIHYTPISVDCMVMFSGECLHSKCLFCTSSVSVLYIVFS